MQIKAHLQPIGMSTITSIAISQISERYYESILRECDLHNRGLCKFEFEMAVNYCDGGQSLSDKVGIAQKWADGMTKFRFYFDYVTYDGQLLDWVDIDDDSYAGFTASIENFNQCLKEMYHDTEVDTGLEPETDNDDDEGLDQN